MKIQTFLSSIMEFFREMTMKVEDFDAKRFDEKNRVRTFQTFRSSDSNFFSREMTMVNFVLIFLTQFVLTKKSQLKTNSFKLLDSLAK